MSIRVPNGDFIPADRKGLTICDATSTAAFSAEPRFRQTRCRHLLLAEGSRRRGRSWRHHPVAARQASSPTHRPGRCRRDLPHDLGRQADRRHLHRQETINTPSMLCVEDYIDALLWSKDVGGLKGPRWPAPTPIAKVIADFVATAVTGSPAPLAVRPRRLQHLGLPEDRRQGRSGARRRRPGELRQGHRQPARQGRCRLRHRPLPRRAVGAYASGPAPRSKLLTCRS